MDFKRGDVGNATEAVRLLLEQLALEEYRFTMGLHQPESDVHVEYASDGWRRTTFTVPDSLLLRSREDSDVRNGLAAELRQKLPHARRRIEAREDREQSVTSLAEAARVVEEWTEHRGD